MNFIFGSLAVLSFALLLWQWLAARRFPLHRRAADPSFAPPVTLLKPLKGCDDATPECLRSWFAQDYAGPVQLLFGVASAEDPVCDVVRQLIGEFPERQAQLVVCESLRGANAKVAKLAELERLAKHDVLIISDADVWVPPHLLANVVAPLRDEKIGLVHCFYKLANPATAAMRWEAVAINADFWSQVLQSRTLKPVDFALGAVMATRSKPLNDIGGFAALADCLADDYQLGNRIARRGYGIEFCPVVVECRESPQGWRAVWKHQLRWARTIRVCQPAPYFFSILSNVTLWSALWLATQVPSLSVQDGQWPGGFWVGITLPPGLLLAGALIMGRILIAIDLQARLTRSNRHVADLWLVPIKDVLQFALWVCAFAGRHVEWRGERMRLRRDGTLLRRDHAPQSRAKRGIDFRVER
jgi:ceramide glucosyltransferase